MGGPGRLCAVGAAQRDGGWDAEHYVPRQRGREHITGFVRALLAWILISIPIVLAARGVDQHESGVVSGLQRERTAVATIADGYARSCANVDANALRHVADRSGLSDDQGVAAQSIDAVVLRWPAACQHLRNATLRFVRAGTRRDRASYGQRVLAFADEASAQVGMLAGAEDAAEALHDTPWHADQSARSIDRDVSAYVAAANRYLAPRSRRGQRLLDVVERERATLRDVTAAARNVLAGLDASLDRRIAASELARRRAIVAAAAGVIAVGILVALAGVLLARRQRATWRAARDRIERLHAEYDRAQALSARDVSEVQFRALFDESPAGVALLDPKGTPVKTNPALARLLPGADPAMLGGERDDYAALWSGTQSNIAFEASVDRGSGGRRDFEISLSPIKASDGTVLFVMSLVRDITERKLAEQLLRHQATHDNLTGLPNRVGFFDGLRALVEHGGRDGAASAVFFIDLDDFKTINDSLGHEAGDAVLGAAAQRLRAQLPGDLVARIGGDEFAVLVRNRGSRADIEQIARLLVAAFLPPLVVDWREAFVTIAVGVAFLERGDDQTASTLVRDADIAMFHAKRSGRSRYAIFNSEMRDGVLRRSILVAEMRKALDQHDFIVAFEPVITLADGSTFGFEALARWRHPHLGTIAPDEFIPIAEQAGMIAQLGDEMLRRTCERLVEWARAGRDSRALRISVNLSVHQMTTGFDERMVELVRSYGLSPGNFTLELTEGSLLAAGDGSTDAVRRLKRAGFKLSIDDFGTGFSSLSYLQRFPFDELKIDRSFVDGPGEALANEPIIAMVVALGRSLGVDVVAEGVETAAQAARLHALGCARAQGYYFSAAAEPLPTTRPGG